MNDTEAKTTISTYVVRLTHLDLSGPYEVQLVATSEAAAINRTRGTAMHYFRHVPLLKADCEIIKSLPGAHQDGDITED